MLEKKLIVSKQRVVSLLYENALDVREAAKREFAW